MQLQIKFRNECAIDFIVATFAVSKLDVLVSCIHMLIVFAQIKLFLFLYTFTSIPSADIKISGFLKRSFAKACKSIFKGTRKDYFVIVISLTDSLPAVPFSLPFILMC